VPLAEISFWSIKSSKETTTMAFSATTIVAVLCLILLPLVCAQDQTATSVGKVTYCGPTTSPLTHYANVDGIMILEVHFDTVAVHLGVNDVLRWRFPRYDTPWNLHTPVVNVTAEGFVNNLPSSFTVAGNDPPVFTITLNADVPSDKFSIDIRGFGFPPKPAQPIEVSNFTVIDGPAGEVGYCYFGGVQLINANPRVVINIPDQSNLFPTTPWTYVIPEDPFGVITFFDANNHPMTFAAFSAPAAPWLSFNSVTQTFSELLHTNLRELSSISLWSPAIHTVELARIPSLLQLAIEFHRLEY